MFANAIPSVTVAGDAETAFYYERDAEVCKPILRSCTAFGAPGERCLAFGACMSTQCGAHCASQGHARSLYDAQTYICACYD